MGRKDRTTEAGAAAAERARRVGETAALDWAAGIVETLGSGLLLFGLSVLLTLILIRLLI